MGGKTIGGDGKTLTTTMESSASAIMMGSSNLAVTLDAECIKVRIDKSDGMEPSKTIPFKAVLMKV